MNWQFLSRIFLHQNQIIILDGLHYWIDINASRIVLPPEKHSSKPIIFKAAARKDFFLSQFLVFHISIACHLVYTLFVDLQNKTNTKVLPKYKVLVGLTVVNDLNTNKYIF